MGTRVYVGNLPSNSTREDVERIFDKYGRISRLDVKTPREGLPAFAFLEFEDPRDAEDAIRGRDNYDVDGVRLRVQIARGGHVSAASRGPPQRSEFRVRVLGLPNSASWQVRRWRVRPSTCRCRTRCANAVHRLCLQLPACALTLTAPCLSPPRVAAAPRVCHCRT